ncbi:MAG: hypothetical protein IPN20_23350 [Haliscomenobacter sp.]|nr:hypothetical protein [Haliscomenobacter sp.]
MPLGRSTLLRIICKGADNIDIATPSVVGIDDWAFKKGQTYGTILVDLGKRKPIELLSDLEVDSHSGLKVNSKFWALSINS